MFEKLKNFFKSNQLSEEKIDNFYDLLNQHAGIDQLGSGALGIGASGLQNIDRTQALFDPGQRGMLNRHLLCSGSEPFWSLDIPNGGPVILALPASPLIEMERGNWRPSENRTDRSLLVEPSCGGRRVSAD